MISKYIILDTETTGIEEDDKICQLCFCVVKQGEADFKVYDTFCKPSVDISFSAMAIHHIVPEMVEEQPKCIDTDVYKKLLELNNEDNILVIHNCVFDLNMLAKEGFESKMKIVDTLRCFKHLYPDSPSKALQYLRYAYGLYKNEKDLPYPIEAHNALGDVLVLKTLLDFLLTTNTIEELIKLTATPVLYKKFSFGKHQGKLIEEIVINDPSYCSYLLNNNMSDPDLGYSLNHYMDICKDKIIHKFNVGKYKGQSVEEISDLGYLSWAYSNMTNMSDGLKQDISKKLGKENTLF